MNKLDNAKRTQIITALVEGNSVRATARMTGCSKNTIQKLTLELGAACSEYLNRTLVNLKSERVQIDELWSFVAAKAKNVTPALEAKGFAGLEALDINPLICGPGGAVAVDALAVPRAAVRRRSPGRAR